MKDFNGSRWVTGMVTLLMGAEAAFGFTLPSTSSSNNLLTSNAQTEKISALLKQDEAEMASRLEVGQWYVLTKEANLGRTLSLPKDTEFTVTEISEDGQYAVIGIDEDLENGQPVELVVNVAALLAAGEPEVLLTDSDVLEQLANLEESGLVIDVAAKKKRKKRRGGGGMTYCLRDVRIRAARYTKKVPQGIAMASQAYPRYKAAGWKPVAYSASVPVGTACFFSGGRSCGGKSRCGHAAIKTSANNWLGAGNRPTPFLTARGGGRVPYRLQGCLIPPGKG